MADYQVLLPLAGGVEETALLARAPARVDGARPQVALQLFDVATHPFDATAEHFAAVAAARAEAVAAPIEVGTTGSGDEAVGYVAVQHCDGGALADRRDRPPREVLADLAAAARGAHQLHDAGVAHAGIRPATVLYTGTGQAVLAAPAAPAWRRPGQTADANPPTRLDGVEPAILRGEPPSRAGDIWALAATAHWALTGRWLHPQLEGDDPLTGVQRVLFEPPVLDPGLDPAYAGLLSWCLRPDPADRPPSAGHLADEFQSLAGARP